MTDPQSEPAQGHDALFRVLAHGVVDWLDTATDSRGERLADTYGLADHDTFRRSGEDMHDRIQMLVDQAQSDTILHATDHHLLLWQVADEGFLLTVDGPTPPRLCSAHLLVDDLVPDQTSGSVAALAVLMAVAQVANQLLTEHRRTRTAQTGPTEHNQASEQPPPVPPGVQGWPIGIRGRPFLTLTGEQPASASPPAGAPPSPFPAPRRPRT